MPTLTTNAAKIKAGNHRTAFPGATKSIRFTASEVFEIMTQPGCDKLEIYHALDDAGLPDSRSMILSGVDSQGNMLPVLKGGTWACPPNCSGGGLGS